MQTVTLNGTVAACLYACSDSDGPAVHGGACRHGVTPAAAAARRGYSRNGLYMCRRRDRNGEYCKEVRPLCGKSQGMTRRRQCAASRLGPPRQNWPTEQEKRRSVTVPASDGGRAGRAASHLAPIDVLPAGGPLRRQGRPGQTSPTNPIREPRPCRLRAVLWGRGGGTRGGAAATRGERAGVRREAEAGGQRSSHFGHPRAGAPQPARTLRRGRTPQSPAQTGKAARCGVRRSRQVAPSDPLAQPRRPPSPCTLDGPLMERADFARPRGHWPRADPLWPCGRREGVWRSPNFDVVKKNDRGRGARR